MFVIFDHAFQLGFIAGGAAGVLFVFLVSTLIVMLAILHSRGDVE